ncbi:hypothetical protein HanPI659440_Chr10g0363951 [Helianthus annuus]|nr:hypothetical protein HanPI659440_Chr10g0363951 [Helianthus annuus]
MRFSEAIDQLKIVGFIEGVCDDELVRQLRYPNLTKKFETLIQQVKNLVMVERLCAFNKEDEMRRRRSACPNNRKRKKFSPYRPKSWMEQPITFPAIYTRNYQGPFVITATIADYSVSGIHIDEGSASEILFESFFDQMDEEIRENLTKGPCPLVRFSGEMVRPLGQIRLPVIIGEEGRSRTLEMTFSVVRAGVSPNVIIGRSGIRALHAVVSTIHGAMKFPTPNGIATILSGN